MEQLFAPNSTLSLQNSAAMDPKFGKMAHPSQNPYGTVMQEQEPTTYKKPVETLCTQLRNTYLRNLSLSARASILRQTHHKRADA